MAKNDGTGRVFPVIDNNNIFSTGLSKRELFAAMALQGILSNSNVDVKKLSDIEIIAIKHADYLIKQLNKDL